MMLTTDWHVHYHKGMGRPALSNLTPLLHDQPTAYYWIGFLMADGSIRLNSIKLTLATKDRDHLEKYAAFIKCKHIYANDRGYVQISSRSNALVPAIVNKFGFKKRKTYHPCDLTWMDEISDDLFLSFAIGFIDGDGYVGRQSKNRKDAMIQIKIHKSWFKNLQKISNGIHAIADVKPTRVQLVQQWNPFVRQQRRYARVTIANSIALRLLKQTISRLRLPAMQRKWEQVDERYISRQETGKKRIGEVVTLLRQGISQTEIAKRMNVVPSAVSLMIKRNNLK